QPRSLKLRDDDVEGGAGARCVRARVWDQAAADEGPAAQGRARGGQVRPKETSRRAIVPPGLVLRPAVRGQHRLVRASMEAQRPRARPPREVENRPLLRRRQAARHLEPQAGRFIDAGAVPGSRGAAEQSRRPLFALQHSREGGDLHFERHPLLRRRHLRGQRLLAHGPKPEKGRDLPGLPRRPAARR
ncbi:hypothetical protein M885DRAFT_8248, partial [Pelagophyceae sp. CCMP2097]